MHQMVLAATNEGVGTCWVTNFNPDILRSALGLKESVKVFGITPLGYPRDSYTKRSVIMRKPIEDVEFFL
jgi:nitroreductase